MADRPDGRGPDLYKVLQVDPEADPEVVQAAYRRLARKFHPDVAPGPEAAARMTAINAAWAVLGDPEERRAYDHERAAVAEKAPPEPASPAGAAAGRPGSASPGPRPASTRPGTAATARPPETVSPDWTSGRSSVGGGYDPRTMRAADGTGAAGPPPGHPSGTVLTFGRYAGWSIGEIARTDVDYLEWLDRAPIGRAYRDELDIVLRRLGRRRAGPAAADARRGLFRRR